MAAKLLNFVTGDAKLCGPCALSAVTGLPSNTWPDEAMTAEEIWGHLEKQRFEHGAPFYVEPLPVDSFAIGRVFWAFCHPALNPDERPLPNPEGRWILAVDPRDGSDEDLHSVAVGVRRWGESWRRVMADNAHREPVPLGKCRWGVYRRAIVVAGLHLVDDPDWPAQRRRTSWDKDKDGGTVPLVDDEGPDGTFRVTWTDGTTELFLTLADARQAVEDAGQ